MNLKFPFYIAKRYAVSKKSHNIINIIAGISTISIAIGTAALIIILSVFNGFESVVESMFSVFDPDLKISAAEGKVFTIDSIEKEKIIHIKGIENYTEVLEENALLRYDDVQFIGTIKGIDSTFQKTKYLDTIVKIGERTLQYEDLDFAILGMGVAYYLNVDINDQKPIFIYTPKRLQKAGVSPSQSFQTESLLPVGIFSVQPEYDEKYILAPLRFMREMLEYSNSETSSVEIRAGNNTNIKQLKKDISQILGNEFVVKDRYEQQESVYKIMKSEKWAVFLILTFILIVASFNAIGSLTMLIIDKKDDIETYRNLGATSKSVRRIFFMEGVLINTAGAVIGLLLGFLVCFVQQQFGIIKLGSPESFTISAYPVKMLFTDFILVFTTVVTIGVIASWLPSSKIK